ncbi:hypothetical protein HGRIS_005535 [Hohenbuehelia grisea]|uniref:Beta-mannosidase B n=1 Tax=Hohenbuehelia grisea TaxID=104357 RepID=A0ABR3JZE7_9AGAR
MRAETVELSNRWYWKQHNTTLDVLGHEWHIGNSNDSILEKWQPASSFPSEIHVELLKSKRIPDPFIGFNEHCVQWIGEAEWLYKTSFSISIPAPRFARLIFEGIDTICDVYLNHEKILETDNMFRTYCYSMSTANLGEYELLLHFKSVKKLAKDEEERFGKVRAGSTNLGDPSRVYIRKAQYDWRWDWGPELLTSLFGILDLRYSVPTPSLALDVIIEGYSDKISSLAFLIRLDHSDGQNIISERHSLDSASFSNDETRPELRTWAVSNICHSSLGNTTVEPWWPVGYGDQNLYDLIIEIVDQDDEIIDEYHHRIGFRNVKLVQEDLVEPDRYGTGSTFLFEVNGVRLFMGELDILVWLDFQFACGVYPAHDVFVESVRAEAVDNVKRLRHHPCLALFCGNNEDYQQVLQWGGIDALPARKIYEHVLPEVVESLTSSTIPYHRGSPYGGKGWDTSDPTIGDVHQWNIWGGKELPYQSYDELGGRFVSEFGMPSLPSMKTIAYWMKGAEASDWHPQSTWMAQHTGAGSFERRFAIAMNDNFRITNDLETYAYTTQLMQSEAMSYAYRSWRREWRGKGKEYNAGVLIWQMNDCWPVTSWAIIDYFMRPKLAYFTISRELAAVSVGISRTVIQNRDNDRPRQFYEFGAIQSHGAIFDVWGTNRTLAPITIQLELSFFDLQSNWQHVELHEATLKPNQSTELLTAIPCSGRPKNPVEKAPSGDPLWTTTYSVVIAARLLDKVTGTVLARSADWPQPFKHLKIPDPNLLTEFDAEREVVYVRVSKPAKGVFFSVDGEDDGGVEWSDNALDVMPDDPQVLEVKGLRGRQLAVAYLGKEKVTRF